MRTSHLALAILVLAAGGCAGPAVGNGLDTPTSAHTSTTSTSAPPRQTEDPTDYLVAMANGAADLNEELRLHGGQVNADHADQSTEGDQLAYLEALYGGESAAYIDYARRLRDVDPPEAFATAHARYVDTLLGLYEARLEAIERLDSIEAWTAWFESLSTASGPYVDFVDACVGLEETAEQVGFVLDLSCPQPPPEVVEVRVEVGRDWQAEPRVAPGDDVVVELEITNSGDTPIQIVVLDIFDGDPLDLPIEDGVVDIALSGVTFDSDSPTDTHFGVAYPDVFVGEDSQLRSEIPGMLPGESVRVTVWGSGPIVVFDYSPGEFERGARVVVERGGDSE